MKKALQPLNNERGVAFLIAIFAMVLTIMIATEVAYETQVEYVSSSQSINRVKAYYAAKAGVELSLFRLLLYKKALAQFGDQLKEQKNLLDKIWQFPFQWPPTAMTAANAVDADNLKKLTKESFMDAEYLISIESEGGKIDINDLGSESKPYVESIRRQLINIFDNELKNNKAFKEKYENFKFDELIENIQDWVDEDSTAIRGGGDESTKYDQPEGAKEDFKLPPNGPFKTLAELHMVKNMEDEFFDLLKDRVTVYGVKGVNVNYAPASVLQSLDPQIKEKILDEVIKRRNDLNKGGPFKDDEDFYGFLESQGVRTKDMKAAKIPLLYDAEHNFRITSTGQYLNLRREIKVVTYDVENLTGRYVEILNKIDEEKDPKSPTPPPNPPPNPASGTPPPGTPSKDTVKIPKGRPTVVFWQES